MKKILVLGCWCIIFSLSCFAQNSKIDSICNAFKKSTNVILSRADSVAKLNKVKPEDKPEVGTQLWAIKEYGTPDEMDFYTNDDYKSETWICYCSGGSYRNMTFVNRKMKSEFKSNCVKK
jgi:hypothetical protein